MRNFVHLHLHTGYSLLDGAIRIPALVRKCREMGMPAVAMTDHGVMYGAANFYNACRKSGVKPIIGCEVYVAPRSRHDRDVRIDSNLNHLVLLCENNEGYSNLLKLVSIAFLEGFYYKPRVDEDLLKEYSRGLICLSSCEAGLIPGLILNGRYDEAKAKALEYRDIFGSGSFYLELQDHGLPEQQKINSGLIAIHEQCDIPVVATNDCHYLDKEDAQAHDMLLCVQTGKPFDDPTRLKFGSNAFYFKSAEEMALLFPGMPRALANTIEIAERCNVELDMGKVHLPHFPLDPGTDASGFLRKLVWERLTTVCPHHDAEVIARLETESSLIEKMGYSDYFLIVSDFINYAKRSGIPVGPGRGSAAGSLVAYVLGITGVDPLKYGLLFERFLNPERVSMPDMDIDFCFERRGEVIDYVTEKYGRDCVAQIITFGTMAARAVVRDVCRALKVPYSEADRIAKLIPPQVGITLDEALSVSADLREEYRRNPLIQKVVSLAQKLEGLPRHASIHAAGVVIARSQLIDIVPLAKMGDTVVTQYPMEDLEAMGLLKMDFLGLRTLTVIDKTIKQINSEVHSFDIDKISLEDKLTFDVLARGDTLGVFQLESSWVRDLLKELEPSHFEDVIAAVALCRPGPMEHIPEFIKAKRGKPHYIHPDLEPILKDTYGVLVYQEQIMQIASKMAGFSLGQADLMRRAVGKKDKELLDSIGREFVAGCLDKGLEKELARELYNIIMKFANYGFNKSHAAAYGLLAYETAYLKANYPEYFMAALLSSVVNTTEKIAVYVEECRRMGIGILSPDINQSMTDFAVVGGKIRFGLAAIKNVGCGLADSIIIERETRGKYASLTDFMNRLSPKTINKRAVESLIKAGAFDCLGAKRSQLCKLHEMGEFGGGIERSPNQLTLFSNQVLSSKDNLPEIDEFPQRELLNMERELLGVYLSGHPILDYVNTIKAVTKLTCMDAEKLKDGTTIIIGGLISAIKKVVTRNKEDMAFATLEDLTGSLELVVFPSIYRRYRGVLLPGMPVFVTGRISIQNDETKVIADEFGLIKGTA